MRKIRQTSIKALGGESYMKKTNTNIKRIKFAKRMAFLLVIQVAIIVVFWLISNGHSPIETSAIKETVITVDAVEYDYQYLNHGMFRVFCDSVAYGFPKIPTISTNEYSMHELYERIHVGDVLELQYIAMENENMIVEARMNNDTLRSLDAYNAFIKTQRKTDVISFVVIETLFVIATVFIIVFFGSELHLFSRRRKKDN